MRSFLLVFCFISFLHRYASAYSIIDAIESALINNDELKVAKQDMELSKAEKKQVIFTNFLPNIALSNDASVLYPSTYITSKDYDGVVREKKQDNSVKHLGHSTRWSLSQNLFSGGRGVALLKSANKKVSSAMMQYSDNIDKTVYGVMESYINVIRSRKRYSIETQRELSSYNSLRMAETLYKVGSATKTDLSDAKANVFSAIASKEGELANVKGMEATFFRKTGDMPPSDLHEVTIDALSIPNNFDEFIDVVFAKSKILSAQKLSFESSKYDLSASMASLLPSINLEMRNNRYTPHTEAQNRREIEGTTAIIQLAIPLFNGEIVGSINKAKVLRKKSEYALDNLNAKIREDSVKTWEQYNQGMRSLRAAKAAALHYGDALKGVIEEYNIGTKSLSDLIEMQNYFFRARLQVVETETSLMQAAFSILYLTGSINTLDFNKIIGKVFNNDELIKEMEAMGLSPGKIGNLQLSD